MGDHESSFHRLSSYETAYFCKNTHQHARLEEYNEEVFVIIMPYSEGFSQGVIVGTVIYLLMLSTVMRRQNQQQSAAISKKGPQEHDERLS